VPASSIRARACTPLTFASPSALRTLIDMSVCTSVRLMHALLPNSTAGCARQLSLAP
jgi:hypothetical protein